jgi:hypothetical protein
MKVISNRLRHSGPHFTAKLYGDVLPEISHDAAEATDAPASTTVPGWPALLSQTGGDQIRVVTSCPA